MKTEILYKLVEDLVLYNEDSHYAMIKADINRIDNDYFENIQRDSEILPSELNPKLRDKVIGDFQAKLSSLLNEAYCSEIAAKICNNSTLEVSDTEIVPLANKLRKAGFSLQSSCADLEAFDEEINQLYAEAKTRTIGERIMTSNKEDVIRYHHALQENTELHVRKLVDVELGKFLCKLADRLEAQCR